MKRQDGPIRQDPGRVPLVLDGRRWAGRPGGGSVLCRRVVRRGPRAGGTGPGDGRAEGGPARDRGRAAWSGPCARRRGRSPGAGLGEPPDGRRRPAGRSAQENDSGTDRADRRREAGDLPW